MPRHSLGMQPLSRYSLPFRIRLRTCFLAGAIAAGLWGVASPGRADAAPDTATIGAHVMDQYRSMSFDDTFLAVARGIRYEPYRGVLRGPVATALAQGGNAADQSLLLAELLKRKGYRVRFVEGVLRGDNLRTLLRGLYPPVLPKITAPPRFDPYVPASDKRLEEVAADHIWLEVEQPGGAWLPLDPSFPRAKIGEAYAKVDKRFEQLPETMYQRLRVSVHERLTNGTSHELGHVEGRVADLALQPMSYLVLSAPQMKRRPAKAKRGAVDMFGGALSGGDTKEEKQRGAPTTPEKPVGIRYRRALFGAGVQQAITDTVVLYDEADSQLQREWLRFDLIRPGQQTRTIERNTFLKNGPGDRTGVPAEFRRYSIAISAGSLKPEVVAQFAKTLGKQLKISDWRKQLDALSREAVSPDLAQRLSRLENSVAMLSGHIAAFSLNAEVSELTRHIAFGNALTYAQVIPSITIISLEGDRKTDYELGADLRLDEVEAWPYPGAPGRVAELFQSARGIQGTMLEGFFIEKLVGKKGGANALSLLTATNEGPGGWLVFEPGQKGQLLQIAGLTPAVHRLLEATLDSGHEIIITARPVQLAGRKRFGWWDHDLASGRVIGVMDDGRHGMAEYTLKTREIGLNENMGYVVGAIVGAVTTEALLAAKVLEKGEITEEAIAAIEKFMKRLQCLSCPKAEAKAKLEAKPTLSCLEIDKVTKFEKGIGFSRKMDFCEKYKKGLKCATSFILDGYKKNPTGFGDFEFGAKAEVKIGCEELFCRGTSCKEKK